MSSDRREEAISHDWEQAIHGSELTAAVEAGAVTRADVATLERRGAAT